MDIVFKLFGYCLIFLLFFLPFIAYRSFYPNTITAAYLKSGFCSTVPLKPNKKWFRSVFAGRPVGLVHLGSGYYAVYTGEDPAHQDVTYSNVKVSDESCYILRKGRFGRFVSVDLSDRCFVDIIKNFNHIEV